MTAILGLLLLAGCSGDGSDQGDPASQPVSELSGSEGSRTVAGPAEDPREKTKRLLYLENALERWWDADQRQEYDRRDSMATLLRTYASEHLDAMVADLRTGSPRRRMVMAGTLGFSGKQEAVPPLLEALQDQYYEVVLHGLASLYHLAGSRAPDGKAIDVEIDPKSVVPFLSHPRAEVRGNAALALSRILNADSPEEYLVPLISAASDADKPTRVHAVAAIAAMHRREGLPHLISALEDPVQLVRVRAALGLGRMGDMDAVPALVSVLDKKNEALDVKKAASRSLSVLMGQPMSMDAETWITRAREAGLPGFK